MIRKIRLITLVSNPSVGCALAMTGVISGALIFMRRTILASLSSAGRAAGDIVFYYSARQSAPLAAAGFVRPRGAVEKYSVGSARWGFLSLAPSVPPSRGICQSMIIARFILGPAVGCASVTVPIYISELARPAQRERLVTVNELMIVTGQFSLTPSTLPSSISIPTCRNNWRLMLPAIPALPALLWDWNAGNAGVSALLHAVKGQIDKAGCGAGKRSVGLKRWSRRSAISSRSGFGINHGRWL